MFPPSPHFFTIEKKISHNFLRLMDKMWKACGLELMMTPYGILATGPNHGLIEVVTNCKTIVDIQMEQGGATAAFNKKCIYNWLKDNATDDEKFHGNFLKSTAGYCVCTYLLGIGDRHNDNILLAR
jgi:phosphatidylinositol kinase/protein kinase (PI-3  family)